jgi:D-sedoheptulose 7-phosphate isomerase
MDAKQVSPRTVRDMHFFRNYFDDIGVKIKEIDPAQLDKLATLFVDAGGAGRKVIFIGNGGSAALASHVSVDLTKVGGVRAHNFNEADLLTCFANDYGYDHWVEKALEFYSTPGDVAVLISSSGQSSNIVNGARAARALQLRPVTLSGFDADNPLRQLGDLNFWVNSRSYNVVEMTHQIWLLAVVDRIVAARKEATA